MSHDKKNRPQVDVTWWDAHNFYIRCPYCEEIHRHGLNSYASGSRTSHCAPGGSYIYYFPVDERNGQVAYEIDKLKARFVNVCTPQDLHEDLDEEEQLEREVYSKVTISDDSTKESEAAKKMVPTGSEGDQDCQQKRFTVAVSDCVNGQVAQVREYLDNSPDAWNFLHGRRYSGNTTLILASIEKSSDMVSLLLDHGSNINAINHDGRSALMEAALWGRLHNVKLLINQGANKSLRDYKKQVAADLAQPKRKNQEERHLRVGGSFGTSHRCEPVSKEDTFNRDTDRREIVRLLVDNDDKRKTVYGAPPTASDYKDYSFRRSLNDQSIVLRGPVANYPVTSDWKTVARLERGGQFPEVPAMSGWGHPEWPSVRVSGRDWTDEVIHIAAVVGHILAPDSGRDQGSPGQFHASHAEKQLITYFINRHVFLPRDEVPSKELEASFTRLEDQLRERSCSSAVVRQLYDLESRGKTLELELFNEDDCLRGGKYDEKVKQLRVDVQNVKKQMSGLEPHAEVKHMRGLECQLRRLDRRKAMHQRVIDMAKIRPPVSLTKAVILISSPRYEICDDCRSFNDLVNQRFGLSIELLECTANKP